MARMPWLRSVVNAGLAGAGLLMSVGCQTAPTTAVVQPPATRFPGNSATNQTGTRTPDPNMPPLTSNSPRIGTPAGQGGPTSPTAARLRPIDPSATASNMPPAGSTPGAIPPPTFNDFQSGPMGSSTSMPPAQPRPTGAITPPAPITSLGNQMPPTSSPFAPRAPIAPPFPTQPQPPTTTFENVQPAGTFPTANVPSAPTLAPRMAPPSTLYPTGGSQ